MICNYDGCGCERPERHERRDCSPCMRGIGILVGIIGGIIFAVAAVLLFINSFLATVGFAVWTALITALVYLFIVLVISVASQRGRDCIRCNLGSLIFGIFGTIFTGFLGVAATLAAGEIFSIIIVALTSFFFAYMIISVLFLIKCIVD